MIAEILTSLIALTASPVYAATSSAKTNIATPSATLTTTPTISNIQKNLEDRIKTIVNDNLSTAEAKLRQEINNKQLVGKIGIINSIQANSFNLESRSQIFQISLNPKTIITKAGSNIKAEALAIKDKVIVIATKTSKSLFNANKIIVIPDTISNRPEVIIGSITKIDPKKRIATFTKTDNKTIEILFSKKFEISLDTLQPKTKMILILSKQSGELVVSKGKILL